MKKKNKPFNEKHPIIYGLLCLIALLLLSAPFIAAILFLLKFIGTKIIAGFNYLSSIASEMEAVVIVALITGGVSITGVIISSIVSKVVEYKQHRREYLYKKREKPYEDFVDMVYKIQKDTKGDIKYSSQQQIEDMYEFSQKLTLWGSNRVIKKWLKFRTASEEEISGQEIMFILEDILYAMRRDMGLRKLKEGKLLSFFVNGMKDVKRIHK